MQAPRRPQTQPYTGSSRPLKQAPRRPPTKDRSRAPQHPGGHPHGASACSVPASDDTPPSCSKDSHQPHPSTEASNTTAKDLENVARRQMSHYSKATSQARTNEIGVGNVRATTSAIASEEIQARASASASAKCKC